MHYSVAIVQKKTNHLHKWYVTEPITMVQLAYFRHYATYITCSVIFWSYTNNYTSYRGLLLEWIYLQNTLPEWYSD